MASNKANEVAKPKVNFKVGDNVEATMGEYWNNVHYPGVISRIDKTTDTCSINFDDGEKHDAIMLTHVRLVKKNRAAKNKIEMPKNLSILKINKKKAALIKAFNFKVGDKVEATIGVKWEHKYNPGVITYINNGDATCAIDFNNGESHEAVGLANVRQWFKKHQRRLTLKSTEEQKQIMIEALKQHSSRKKQRRQRKYTAFELLEAAVVVIQAYIRGYYARKYLVKRQKAAILLLYRYRRYKAKKELARRKKLKSLGPRGGMYLNLNRACNKLVLFFRMVKAKGDAKRRKRWIVIMQSLIRRWSTRQIFHKCIYGFTKIQSLQRKKVDQTIYFINRNKIIKLQSNIRAYEATIQYQRNKYLMIKLQNNLRRRYFRELYSKTLGDVTRLQSHMRKHMQRKLYMKTIQSFTAFQAIVRQKLIKKQYLHSRKLIILCQSLLRRFNSLQWFWHQRYLVIKIQASLKRRHFQYLYNMTRNNFIALQALTRKWVYQRKYIKTRHAFLRLQCLVRQFLSRKILQIKKTNYLKRVLAATQIQAVQRGGTTRYQLWLESIETLRKQAEELYNLGRIESATKIQSYARRYIKKKQFKYKRYLITKTQSHARRAFARTKSRKRLQRIKRVQSFARIFLIKQKLKLWHGKVIIIQRNWRRWSCMNHLHNVLTISMLQLHSFARMAIQRSRYLYILKCVRRIQNSYRLKKFCGLVKRLRPNIIKTQAEVRRHIFRNKYIKMKQSTLIIQRYIRRYLCQLERLYLKSGDYAVVIQAFWRGSRRRLRIYRGARVISSVISQTRLRRVFNKEYQILMLEAIEKHRVGKLLKGLGANDGREISDVGINCLIETRLKNTKKQKFLSKYARLIHAAVQIQRIFRGRKTRLKVLKETNILIRAIGVTNKWRRKEHERREWMLEKMALDEENLHNHDVLTISASMINSLLQSHNIDTNSKRNNYDETKQKYVDESDIIESKTEIHSEEKSDSGRLAMEDLSITRRLKTSSPSKSAIERQRMKRKKKRWIENKFKPYLPSQSRLVDLHPKYEDVNSVYTRLSTHSLHLLHKTKVEERQLKEKKEICSRKIQHVARTYLRMLHKVKERANKTYGDNEIAQRGVVLLQARRRAIRERIRYKKKQENRKTFLKWEKKYNLVENTKKRLRGITKLQAVIRGRIVRNYFLRKHEKVVRENAIKSFRESQEEIQKDRISKKEKGAAEKAKKAEISKLRIMSEEIFAEIQFQLLEMKNYDSSSCNFRSENNSSSDSNK